MDEATLNVVRAGMFGLQPPGPYDKVYKDECMLSFDTPESKGGLFINLRTFQAFGEDFVHMDHEKTKATLYLHEKWQKVPLSEEEQKAQQETPEKLALGVEGGFQVERKSTKIQKSHSLAIMPTKTCIPLPCTELPELVLQTISSILAHSSASVDESVMEWEEHRTVSKYAEGLEQLDAVRKISPNPKDWKCDETGVTENLWLNLSTGFIGSGRQNWDGSGGNGAALRHFEATGKKYPLVVKLGTITPRGADVYSYADDENDMVTDPYLAQHLSHWGIDMMSMEKTEKTMTELQINLNMSFEFDKITESGADLKPLSGPGYVGLENLGNSCYMNSVLQVLWSLPDLSARYVAHASEIFTSIPDVDAASDLPAQMAKVGVALETGRTGQPPAAPGEPEVKLSVRPQSFKTLVGRGHQEFSSARQQDACEYFQHLLELIARTEHSQAARLNTQDEPSTSSAFDFVVEDRIQCQESKRVSYKQSTTNVLSLSIPVEAATNKLEVESYKEREVKRAKLQEAGADVYIGSDMGQDEGGVGGAGGAAVNVVSSNCPEEPVIPQVPFQACLEQWAGEEVMEDYFSAALGRKTVASKRARFGSFPPYLMLQMKRYYVGSNWVPKKLEVLVDVPDQINLEPLRGTGPQEAEQLQPEEPESAVPASAATGPAPDMGLVGQLTAMGFSENGCIRAVVATNNAGVEAAMEWVLGHMEDADFNEPLQGPSPASAIAIDPAQVAMLSGMGFSDRAATAALTACDGSIERAADWLFSHMDDLESMVERVLQPSAPTATANASADKSDKLAKKVRDGSGRYELVGFISHMGNNTGCGHYVCHVKKEGRWVIYNDTKVAVSEHPPRDLGYMYLFKRMA